MIDARIWALRWIYREEARVSEYQQERDADEIADAERFFRGIQDDARTEIHAEAAAMREALLLILEIIGNGGVMPGNGTDQCIDIAQKALASDAGRALVEELAAANAEVCKLRDAVYGPREIVQALQRQVRDAEAERDRLARELEAAKADRDHARAVVGYDWLHWLSYIAVTHAMQSERDAERQRADAAENRLAAVTRERDEARERYRSAVIDLILPGESASNPRILSTTFARAESAERRVREPEAALVDAVMTPLEPCLECNCSGRHASHCSAAKDERRAMERVIEAARLAIRQLAAIGINVKLATLEEALAALDAAWAKKEGE